MSSRIFISLLLVSFFLPTQLQAAPGPGSLIKLSCPANADVNDPCKAVYFYGHDSKRHAFSNDKVYFSWYADFAGVQTVAGSFMTTLPLGQNVTYRPGTKLVKFITDPKVYAIGLGGSLRWIASESAATTLYGADWNKKVDDISDAFFANYRFDETVNTTSDFSPTEEQAAAKTIDDNLPSTFQTKTVITSNGNFSVRIIKLQQDAFKMITDAKAAADCQNNCQTASLSDFAMANGATIGMHGTYFCPDTYPDCASKTNTFLWPFFDTPSLTMINKSSLAVHQGPMLVETSDGDYEYFHRTSQLGSTAITAGISNYPSLVENGVNVVMNESRLDDGMKTLKSSRGGIGIDDRFVYLVVADSATVVDLANIFVSLNIKDGMNLDGGGSTAMMYNGKIVAGPGRSIPNAILFTPR